MDDLRNGLQRYSVTSGTINNYEKGAIQVGGSIERIVLYICATVIAVYWLTS